MFNFVRQRNQSKANRLFLQLVPVRAFASLVAIASLLTFTAAGVSAQTASDKHESERSDKLTGGKIELAEFAPDQPDIRLTLNVPSFRLTLWQNGKEVKSYYVGVGLKAHPLYIGDREATQIIWNPD